jgi:hypothetical protein
MTKKNYVKGDFIFEGSVTAEKLKGKGVITVAQDGTGDFNGDTGEVIQQAIDYVNGLGGGTVFIKKGTYLINSSVVVCSNLILQGEGYATVFTNNDDTVHIIGTVADLENITIKNIYFKGNQTNSSHNEAGKTGRLIHLNDGNVFNITVTECYFSNTSNFALSIGSSTLLGSEKAIITKNIFYKARAGIGTSVKYPVISDNILIQDLSTSSGEGIDVNNIGGADVHALINNNILTGYPADSIDTSASPKTIIRGNYVYGRLDTTQGIMCGSDSIVENNIVENCQYGIRANGSNIVISNNIINTITEYGIDSYISSVKDNQTITGNQITTTGVRSINAFSLTNSIISNNVLKSFTGIGLYVSGSDNVKIVGNQFITSVNDASLIKGSIANSLISQNFMKGTITGCVGISEFGNNNIFTENIFDTLNLGLYAYNSNVGLIVKNNIFKNSNYGVSCRDSSVTFQDYLIEGNLFDTIATAGIDGNVRMYLVQVMHNRFKNCAIDMIINRTTGQQGTIGFNISTGRTGTNVINSAILQSHNIGLE